MIRIMWFLLFLGLIPSAYANTLTVAIIDTGYTAPKNEQPANLCKQGHRDMTNDTVGVPADTIGHGTNITHIIQSHLSGISKDRYCFVIIKYTDGKHNETHNYLKALSWASALGVKMLNMSGGGTSYMTQEERIVKSMLDRGVTIVAAAGNEGRRIEPKDSSGLDHFYPASLDDRIVVVGAVNKFGHRLNVSNFGDIVTRWEQGQDIKAGGYTLTGTSQATANASGKILRRLLLKGE